MATTKNYGFYKPELTDKFDTIGYGVGTDNTFEDLFLQEAHDKTFGLLSQSEYETKLKDAGNIEYLKDCLQKTYYITDTISDDATKVITSNVLQNLFNEANEQFYHNYNNNISVDDKIFIKITADITNSKYDSICKIMYNNEDYYFVETDASTYIKYKKGLNNGADTFTNTTFYGSNMVEYNGKYYSVYENKIYIGLDPFTSTSTITLGTSGHIKIYNIDGILFTTKRSNTTHCDLYYSKDGENFTKIDLTDYAFKTSNLNIYSANSNIYLSNEEKKIIVLDGVTMKVKTMISGLTKFGEKTGTFVTKMMFCRNAGAFYAVADIEDTLYLVKSYDGINFTIDTEFKYDINNIAECGEGIFVLYNGFLLAYSTNKKEFLKLYFFTNKSSLQFFKNSSGLCFSKSNSSATPKLYLFNEDVKSLRDILKDLGDEIKTF